MDKPKRTFREILIPTLTMMDDSTIRIVFSIAEYEMASLYFERPKKLWTNKPIMPHTWLCKDARIADKMIYVNGIVEPKDLIQWGMELIKEGVNQDVRTYKTCSPKRGGN